MSSFKDSLEQDMATFFNIDELAEMRNIDGTEMPVLLDTDRFKDRPRQPIEMYHATNGVYVEEICLFVRLSDLGDRPVTGQHMHVDDERYLVKSCTESAGILEIVLEAYQA